MRKENYRNIAIIAHVDVGKTTMVDGLLRQSGTFRDNQKVDTCVMDSMDLEKERNMTIMAKNTSILYKGVKINIVDTPGHSDFGGEVERALNLVDGAILLVDAGDGPLPQTRFVLKNALAKRLPIIVVINKIDRADARVEEVINKIYDLFIDLDANEKQIEFPILYTIGREGIAHNKMDDDSKDLQPLFEAMLKYIPGPEADDNEVPQFLATNLDYDSYVGQMAIGRMTNGTLEMNKSYALCGKDGITNGIKFSALYTFEGLGRTQVTRVEAGDIVAVAGVNGIKIGDTITSSENPKPLPRIHVGDPTVSMTFYVNNSPFAGREGKFVTSRHLRERLEKETLGNVAIKMEPTDRADAFEVHGRGELQMAILIETMRREGYELMVSKPRVITKVIDGKTMEPVEHLFLDIPEEFIGVLTEKLAGRKGRIVNITNAGHGRVNMEFTVPVRGLIGFFGQFMTDTKGLGVMNTLFEGYQPWFGQIPQREAGVLVSDRSGKVTSYASFAMEDRGELFVDVGTEVYGGMVIGERNRNQDLYVNITKEKKLTNIRSSTSDVMITLRSHRVLSLDQAIEYIAEDELVEATPKNIRIRKMTLDMDNRTAARARRSDSYDVEI